MGESKPRQNSGNGGDNEEACGNGGACRAGMGNAREQEWRRTVMPAEQPCMRRCNTQKNPYLNLQKVRVLSGGGRSPIGTANGTSAPRGSLSARDASKVAACGAGVNLAAPPCGPEAKRQDGRRNREGISSAVRAVKENYALPFAARYA